MIRKNGDKNSIMWFSMRAKQTLVVFDELRICLLALVCAYLKLPAPEEGHTLYL